MRARQRVRLWGSLLIVAGLACVYGLLFDRSVRPDPFATAPSIWDWLVNRQPHPALARIPVVPVGILGLLAERPADTAWINSPYSPIAEAGEGAPGPARADWHGPLISPAHAMEPAKAPDLPQEILNAPAQNTYDPKLQYQQQTIPNTAQMPIQRKAPDAEIAPNAPVDQDYAPAQTQAPIQRQAMEQQAVQPPPEKSAQQPDVLFARAGDFALPPRQPGEPARMIGASCQPDGLACTAAVEGSPPLRSEDGGRSWQPDPAAGIVPESELIRRATTRVTEGRAKAEAALAAWQRGRGGAARWQDAYARDIPPGAVIRSARADAGRQVAWLSTGWNAAGADSPRPAIIQTRDGGQSWERLSYARLPAPWVLYFALPLAVFAAYGFGAAAVDLRTLPSPRFSIADEAASDRPISWDDYDALGIQPLAYALSRFLRNRNTEPPLTIAIQGSWGSGKSSLMNLVAEDLRGYGARPVWFNAWHHQKEEHLLAALLENIKSQAIPEWWRASGILFRLRLWWLRGQDEAATVFALACIGLVALGIAYLALGTDALGAIGAGLRAIVDRETADRWWADIEALLGLGTVAGIAGIVAALRTLRPLRQAPAALMASLRARARLSDFSDQIGFRYRFAREFGEVCRALRSGRMSGMVILIDDLDRCQPANVLELLEAVNFLTSAGPCFVFLGIDEKRVLIAMTKCLDADEGEARAYLEKLINLAVPVPPATPLVSAALLGQERKPVVSPWPKRLRRFFQGAFDRGPGLLALGTAVALVLVGLAELSQLPSAVQRAEVSPAATADGATGVAPTAGFGGGAPAAAIPAVEPAELDAGPLAPHSLPVLFTLALVAFLLAARVLAPKPELVTDSEDFREALKIWNPIIFRATQTPRGIKRYQNRLRLMATALQDNRPGPDWIDRLCARLGFHGAATRELAATSVPETTLVALGAVEALIPDALCGETDFDRRLQLGSLADADDGKGPYSEILGTAHQFARRYPDQWPPSREQIHAYRALSQDVRLTSSAEVESSAEGPAIAGPQAMPSAAL